MLCAKNSFSGGNSATCTKCDKGNRQYTDGEGSTYCNVCQGNLDSEGNCAGEDLRLVNVYNIKRTGHAGAALIERYSSNMLSFKKEIASTLRKIRFLYLNSEQSHSRNYAYEIYHFKAKYILNNYIYNYHF